MGSFSQNGSLFKQNSEQFDFNMGFEEVFFSIIPASLFMIAALWRTASIVRKPVVVNGSIFRLIKVCAILVYGVLQLALVVLAAAGHFHATTMFMATSALKLLAAVVILPLSIFEHTRSARPSMLLMGYLLLTILLDGVQSRTLYLSSTISTERAYSTIFTTGVAVKFVMLLLESQQKSKWAIQWDKKEHSPEETSGIFSLGVFFWLNRLFLSGYKKVLAINDLYPLDGAMDPTRLHEKFSRHLDIDKMRGDKFGLTKVLIRTLMGPLLLPVIPRLALLGFAFAQPLFIEGLLDYLSQDKLNPNVGYGFIGASFFIYSGIVVSWAFHRYYSHRMRTMLRSILVTETFLTATKARIGTNDDSAALTLMSTDIERIRMGFRQLHDIWASVIQAALSAWMLDKKLGVVFVAPIGLVILCFFGLVALMNHIGTAQRRWMSMVQKRVGLTATVIASMKSLKIAGLSSSVSTFLQRLRVTELTAGVLYRKLYIGAAVLGFIPMLIGPALAFAFTQKQINSSNVFTGLSFLTLMTQPLSQIFQNIPEVISGLACIGRIQAFMECETREDFRKVAASFEKEKDSLNREPSSEPQSEVVIENGSFGWEQDKFVLQEINAKIPKSSLTLVVGPVGSGKSTLCKVLLGEIPFHQGNVTLRTWATHVGFCDQTAFALNGTIKENIIGFSPVNEERYAEVVDATALAFDFGNLPQGDETNVGSDGISLSGGQKQRISLARALYLQTHFLVLDDVFSGLDADTEEQVFRKVFGSDGLLRRRQATVLLCTHSVRHLQAADYVIALEGGGINEQGTFDKLMAGDGYVRRLGLKSSSESDTASEELSITKSPREFSSPVDKIKVVNPVASTVDASRQVGDGTVYNQYMKSMGWLPAASAIFFACLWGFFLNFATIWLTYWVDDTQLLHPTHSFAYWTGLYALLQICALISLFLLAASIWLVSIKRAGSNLHENILKTLIRAPLRFFTETDIGVTTNLFSQDLNLIDTELPDATLSTLYSVTQVLGEMAVMIVASPYIAVTFPFLAVLLYVLQKFYLRTSRQLRLLDLEAKSPLYTHFLDMVRGITTLRAFGFISEDIQKNARLLTSSQRPSYLLLVIQEWLNSVLNVVVMLLAVGLTTFAVRFHSGSALTGAALYSLLSFGDGIAGIVLFWTKLETSLGAIARLKTFNETVKPEDRDGEDIEAPEEWPQRGVVELKGVSAQYAKDEDDAVTSLALRDIHLTINSREKVAICGRTGSGKSSLVALLLKLLDPISTTAENIVIDDLPLHRLNRSALRQRIIAVPQEAVFLPDGSTVQNNLDIAEEATPEECKAVLESIGLWDFVDKRGGLAAGMNASSFSAGQRQLLSFGRALLRRTVRERKFGSATAQLGGILILDEVSSSVDQETECIMQEIIRTEFRNYTVIAVSHRLDMIMDFDRVVVMDTGEIVEVGKPAVLAQEVGTRFGDLVRAGNK